MIKTAVFQAGGEGTRLRPVTYEIPKPLVPVQGRPILSWQTLAFAKAGVERVFVIIPEKWEQAFEAWREGMRRETSITIDLWIEREKLGTMGAFVHHLADEFGSDPMFVSNADELKGLDLLALSQFHVDRINEDSTHAATIALVTVPNPQQYGVAELEGSRIVRFHEKPEHPPTSLISSGLYVIEPKVFAEVAKDKTFLMFEKDLFPRLASEGRLGGCPLDGPWFDCGTLERWEKAIHEWPGVI